MSKKDLSKESQVSLDYIEPHSGMRVIQREDGRLRVTMDCFDAGKTEQSHKDGTDINYILMQHVKAGVKPALADHEFIDFTKMPDYQTCLNTVLSIDGYFDQLPIKVKEAFKQDPALLMDAIKDPTQRGRLIELGVLNANTSLIEGSPSSGTGETPVAPSGA